MYVKYLNGTVVELVKAKYTKTLVQNVDISQVPPTDVSIVRRLGLKWQEWVVSGAVTLTSSVMWRDIAQVSLDNVSWRNCITTAVDFPRILIDQTLYELRLNVSPLLEGAVVRYPTTGYKWGNQSIYGISQAGNVNAFPIIHYLAPLFYAPLSNTLIDFAGQAVTFTRTAPKTHNGVAYPINTPIFDGGLYLASDTAQDVATWTPPASTVKTVAMQLKSQWLSRYPSPWSIGGGGVNLLTANQSNAETNTTGMQGIGGTFTRNTSAPIAGAADFKIVATTTSALINNIGPYTSVVAGRWHVFQFLAKGTGSGLVKLNVAWYASNGTTLISQSVNTGTTITAGARLYYAIFQAPAGAALATLCAIDDACTVGDVMQVDSLMIELIPFTLNIWMSPNNYLQIDTINTCLSWYDGVTAIILALPASYLSGAVMDVVVIEDTSHAVTIAVHPAGGSWTSATGTLAALTWPQLTLGNLEGSIANLVEYPYVLTSAEYQALAYSSLSLLFNTLYIGNRYAGEIVKGSDKRLLNALGSDISALLGGVDIPIGSAAVTIAQSQGLSARWYVEVKRTDV